MHRRKLRVAVSALCLAATLTALAGVNANRTVGEQPQASGFGVDIIADGVKRHIRTSQMTIGAVLKKAGIEIGPSDLVYPAPDEKTGGKAVIRVVRVVDRVVLEEKPVPFKTVRKATTSLRLGLTKMVSEGRGGLNHVYYHVRCVDGVEKRRTLIRSELVTKPQDRIILVGGRGGWVSRGSFTSRQVLTMQATAYDPGPRSCGRYANGTTCTGMRAGYGVVAVDPRVIPLRTRLYIEGYGFAIAGDRGRAIKGNRIDLGFGTFRAAKTFGRRHVKVHILD